MKERLLSEMESYFGDDKKRIQHAKAVLTFAEKLLSKEPEADDEVVIAASILHDIGIHEAERKHGSSAGKYQEIEGPPIAREIMKKIGIEKEVIDEVSEIIAHHHTPGKIDSVNFRIVYDSDWLVNLGEEYDTHDEEKVRKLIELLFLTEGGKKLAKEIYLE